MGKGAKKARAGQALCEGEPARAADDPASPWRLESVTYKRKRRRLVLGLAMGVELSMPCGSVAELEGAKRRDMEGVCLSPSGDMVVVEAIGARISAGGLVKEALAALPVVAMAACLETAGSACASMAKRASSAEKGKKGGRPKRKRPEPDGPAGPRRRVLPAKGKPGAKGRSAPRPEEGEEDLDAIFGSLDED